MIPIFRKIRKKMADDNRPLKYLRYAIGEVILVVIGILIAVSINNWNEKRKIKNKGKEYIKEIYTDVTNEASNLSTIVKELTYQYNSTKSIIEIIESEYRVITDTIKFTRNHWAPAHILIIQRDQNTFDNLNNSGQSGLLKNDSLTKLLDHFYKNFDERISNYEEFPIQIRMDYRRITFQMGSSADFNNEQLNKKLTKNYINEYLDSEANYEVLLSILKTSHWNIGFFKESLEDANNLINFLEEEYFYLEKKK